MGGSVSQTVRCSSTGLRSERCLHSWSSMCSSWVCRVPSKRCSTIVVASLLLILTPCSTATPHQSCASGIYGGQWVLPVEDTRRRHPGAHARWQWHVAGRPLPPAVPSASPSGWRQTECQTKPDRGFEGGTHSSRDDVLKPHLAHPQYRRTPDQTSAPWLRPQAATWLHHPL